MPREKFGDPDYYTPPEIAPFEVGGIPDDTAVGPEPSGIPIGAPEPSGVIPDIAMDEASPVIPVEPEEAAFTMAKQPEAPKATAADKEDTGWWANTGSGLMLRAGTLLENLGTFGEKRVQEVDRALADDPESGSLELDKKLLRAGTAAPRIGAAGLAAAATNLGLDLKEKYGDYKVRGDWETVEDSWSKATESADKLDILDAAIQTGEFMLETGVVSLPDMVGMIAAMPAYLGSRTEELATDRAEKNNRDQPNAEDYAVGATTATIVTGIDKLSLGFATQGVKDLLQKGFAPAMKRIAQATAVEGVQEGVQEGLEYTGTTAGTETEFSPEELKRSIAAGTVGGMGFGAGIRTGAEVVDAFRSPPQPTGEPTPDEPQPEDDDYQATPEEAGISEADIITPPPEPVAEGETPVTEAPEPAAEKPATGEAATTPKGAEPVTEETFEERVNKAWKGKGLKKLQRDFAIKHGIMPEDVEPTGAAGAYTPGDLQRAFDARKSVETDEQLTQVLKDAGLKEAAIPAEGDGGAGGAGAGAGTPAEAVGGVTAEAEAAPAEGEPSPVDYADLLVKAADEALRQHEGFIGQDLDGFGEAELRETFNEIVASDYTADEKRQFLMEMWDTIVGEKIHEGETNVWNLKKKLAKESGKPEMEVVRPAPDKAKADAIKKRIAFLEGKGQPALSIVKTPAKTLDSFKYTRGTKKLAEEGGLTAEDVAKLTPNAQGNIPRLAIEQAVREKSRADRGDVSKEVNDVVNFVEDNFPLGNYDTEKTGRTRQGKLSDKVAAVSSLVTLVDRLRKNSSAPQEVLDRATELAANYKRIGKVSDAQEQGRGFTSTIKAGVLDPLLDELTELAIALDQGRAAKEGTIQPATLEKLKDTAQAIEEKVVEKTGKTALTTTEVATTKAKLAKRRAELRKAKQGARRIKGIEKRQAALKAVVVEEQKLSDEEKTFSKQAGAVEKAKPTAEKRAKPGKKVSSGKTEVTAKKFTNVGEARNVMEKLGVPISVTGTEGSLADMPIDVNHYSLMVGLYKKLRKAETDAAKDKDAKAEQKAKADQRKLADITKDIISTPDELVEGAHTRAASALAKMGVPKSVIDDVIDFAETSRKVVQREQKRAEDTTEEIREIAAEEDFAEEGQEVDLEEQVAGATEMDLQTEYDAAVDSGDFAKAEKILASMALTGNKTTDIDADSERLIYGEDTESDTTLLSDEYDANEAAAAQEGYYAGDGFVQYGPGYFGGQDTEFDKKLPEGHDKRREAQARSLAAVLDVVAPKVTEKTRRLMDTGRKAQAKLGTMLAERFGIMDDSGRPISGAAILTTIKDAMPKWHPYHQLANMMLELSPYVEVYFMPTGEGAARPTGYHDLRPALSEVNKKDKYGREYVADYRFGNGSPKIVIDPVKFMRNPQHGVHVVMHEFVHHFTSAATRMDNDAAQYIDALRVAVLEAVDAIEFGGTLEERTKSLSGGRLYGLSNIDEFIAEAFSNPDFQLLLMSLEAPQASQFSGKKSGARKSLWEAFIESVKRILGIPQVSNSVLGEVIAHSDNIFYNAKEKYTSGSSLRGADNISTHWSDVSISSGDGKVWRSTKTAGETTVAETWEENMDRTVAASRQAFGDRGADWGRQAMETMEGNDPEAIAALKDGSPAAEETVVQELARTSKYSISKLREMIGSISLGLQTMDQIERNHGDKFGGKLTKYMDILRNRNRVAHRWQNRGAAIDEQWEAVEKAGNANRFSEFVQSVTMSELHPDFSWDKQKHLFSKNEYTVKKAQHQQLKQQFNKLSKAEKKLFNDMRTFFTAQRKELSHTALRHAARVHIKDQGLADEVYEAVKKHGSVAAAVAKEPQLTEAFDGLAKTAKDTFDNIMSASKLRGAYFPLRRYGDWVVEYSRKKDLGTYDTQKEAVAATREWMKEHPSNKAKKPKKTDDGKYHAMVEEKGVEFFESTAEGSEAISELRADGWTTTDNPTAKEDWGGRFDIGALQVLQQAKKKFAGDATASKAEKERNAALTAALDTAFIELLAETSIRKSTLQRKNVRGASLDGRRVFAERVFAGSYALADAENSFDQTQALEDIWGEARKGGKHAYKQGQVARELTLRERHTVNDRRSNRFNDWVGSLGFLGFLAGPSYPIINATQPFMVGLPWLGARYGAGATGALFNNVAKLGPAVLKELIDSGMGVRRNPHQAVQNAINAMAKRGGGGADMLRAMRDAGIMDSTFIDAVSEAAKAGGWNISQSDIFKFAASAPKVVEVMNRTVMGATAYQLEMQKSGNKQKAIDTAKEAILQTQFDYSDFNKPRFFKNPGLRPFLLFKMYPQGIYGLLASSVKQMTNGSPEEQRQGRNTLLGLTASHTIMGGALGGLFMEPVRMLLSIMEMLYPPDDDEKENLPFWDKQQFDINMRQMAVDVLGDQHAAELLMRGIPRQFGFDLSGRLGLHNLMFMGMADDGTGKNIVHKALDQLGGAPMSVATSWERAYQFAKNGKYKRAMETAAPKALRDIMGAHRAGTEGLETFGGTRYATPSEFDPMDHFIKMLGFSSAKQAELMEERWAQMSYDMKRTAQRSTLLNRLHEGATTFAEVNRTWNVKYPDYRITMGDLLRKRTGQMKDEMLTSKGYPVNPRKPSIRREARF